MNAYYDPEKRHHRPQGFQNNYTEFEGKSLAQVLRWRWQAAREHLPPPPREPIARVEADHAFIHANAKAGAAMQPAVTWIGHSTVLAQLGGLNVLTDPMFSERASPVGFIGPKRHHPPGLALGELPRIDLVIASHNHYDHLDLDSVRALGRQAGGPPVFIVPLGLGRWLQARGMTRVVELDWWESHRLPGPRGEVEVMLVPAQHWSARGIRDRMATLWGGFAVLAPDCHLFHAGDTGYSRDFIDIREHLNDRQGAHAGGGFDIALLPIGGYAPRWFMSAQHVNVEEAVAIHRDLGAKRSLGVHWGSFALTDEPLDEPPRVLAELRRAQHLDEDRFFVLAVGQTRRIAPRVEAGASVA